MTESFFILLYLYKSFSFIQLLSLINILSKKALDSSHCVLAHFFLTIHTNDLRQYCAPINSYKNTTATLFHIID